MSAQCSTPKVGGPGLDSSRHSADVCAVPVMLRLVHSTSCHIQFITLLTTVANVAYNVAYCCI